jgi:hypothetical protein
MPPKRQAWKIYPDQRTGTYIVRFRHGSKRHNLSTGTIDYEKAVIAAENIYIAIVTGKRMKDVHSSTPGYSLADLGEKWLANLKSVLDEKTIDQYGMYLETHWSPFSRQLIKSPS